MAGVEHDARKVCRTRTREKRGTNVDGAAVVLNEARERERERERERGRAEQAGEVCCLKLTSKAAF